MFKKIGRTIMKKIIVNESILRQIIAEMAKERKLVTEIKVTDAYARFYDGKIPQDIYTALMKGTDKMTPFHKLCLDSLIDYYSNRESESDSWTDQLLPWAKEIGDKWSAANNDARQFLLRYIESRSFTDNAPLNFQRLANITNKILSKQGHTEGNYCDRGLVKLYENDKVLVTCTTSYSASKKYYGDTHWCTASDIGGNYNGFKMFGDYTCNNEYEDNMILVQFVDKENREKTIQVAFEDGLCIYQACDFFDHELDEEDVKNYINEVIGLDNLERIIPWDELCEKTCQMYDEEYEYWEEKTITLIRKVNSDIKEKVKNGEYDSEMIAGITKAINNKWTRWFDNGILVNFVNTPERYKAEGTYVCTAYYYDKYYEALNNFQEDTDIDVTPKQALLIKRGTRGDYYIAERVNDVDALNAAPPAFVILENDKYAAACNWDDFSPILTGKCSTTLRSATIFFEVDYNWGDDEYPAKVIDHQTGEIIFDGKIRSVDPWNDSFIDTEGYRYAKTKNGWTKTQY